MTIQLQAQLDKCTAAGSHVTDLIANTSSTIRATATAGNSRIQPVQTVDRSRNIVITGIDENQDSRIWRTVISRALSTAVGREVTITDALRLGRFSPGKNRPILVKLNSPWDRRLALSGARALASSTELKHVYLSADEPLEIRRKNTFENLKLRAIRQNKSVSIDDNDFLVINNVPVFSVRDGFVKDVVRSDHVVNDDVGNSNGNSHGNNNVNGI